MQSSTIGSLLRSTQAYCSQLCEKQTLDTGIAFYSERFGDLPEVNQFREVVLNDGGSVSQAFQQAKAWFDARNLTCHRWAPALDTPVEPLRDFLAERGFQARPLTAMTLTEWVPTEPEPNLRVLPARAMRPIYVQSFLTLAPATTKARQAFSLLRKTTGSTTPSSTCLLQSHKKRHSGGADSIKSATSAA